MSNKKAAKKEEERQRQLQLAAEQQKRQEQRQIKQARLKQLTQKSAPLVNYGLIDAYQFFLAQLASSGIPQGNVFQFAAQSLLKYEKNKRKKIETLREVEEANLQAVRVVNESSPVRPKPRGVKEIKPQLLPFKGDLSEQQKEFLGKQ